MRIAIVHYHLRPGGVTRVIQNAVSVLPADDARYVVIAGEAPSQSMPVSQHVVVEALGYADTAPQRPIRAIVKELENTAKQALGGRPDVWHIHNHALGKNLVLSEVVYLLAQEGQRLLLQPHDFAEDGRPENYRFLRDNLHPDDPKQLGAHLYPQGMHVHYALINQRDLTFLQACGVPEAQLHFLPNAIRTETAPPSEQPSMEKALYLYPGRGIRRKNIGEFLLWAALAQEDELFAITRAPKNPAARPIYDDWVAFAQSLNIAVDFEFGQQWQADFQSLLKAAHALVTTSVAEGFGLAFLEPWLVERPLVGRKLPEITGAIEDAGVDLSSLYARLDVPLAWIGKARFIQELTLKLQQLYQTYGRTASEEDFERAITAAIQNEQVDFGKLDESFQKLVIQHLMNSAAAKQEIRPTTLCPSGPDLSTISQNRQAVIEHFNLDTYGNRLMRLYRTVAESRPEALKDIDADRLLDQFLAPERFCLLRT